MTASTPALIGTGNPEAGDYAGLMEELKMNEPNSPREAVEQHRESLYPTLPPAELIDAHGFENLTRVVVAQHGVYGRATDGHWVQLKPLSEVYQAGGQSEPKSGREAINDLISQHRAQAEMMKIAEAAAQEKNRAKFKVGDIVVLRSGGPKMTVWRVSSPPGNIETEWFAGDLLQRDAFAEAELELADQKFQSALRPVSADSLRRASDRLGEEREKAAADWVNENTTHVPPKETP